MPTEYDPDHAADEQDETPELTDDDLSGDIDGEAF
jgi:hypothetical protein